MFAIYRKNRKFNNKTFKTYEAARSYVRKYMRQNAETLFHTNAMFTDNGWINHANPSLKTANFEIRNI